MKPFLFFGLVIMLLSANLPEKDCLAVIQKENFSELEAEVLRLVNNHRLSLGLNVLKSNELISKAALIHTRNMAVAKIPLSHDGFDERADRLLEELNGSAAAENVAWGHPTARLVVKGWLESKDHRANIEGDYNLTGIGIARGRDGELYYTQIFIRARKDDTNRTKDSINSLIRN